MQDVLIEMSSAMRNTTKKIVREPKTALDRNHMIGSVASTMEVLEIFSRSDEKMIPLQAFVEATGRPKSSVHRMLATLVNLGYLEQPPGASSYRLTLKLWRLGLAGLRGFDLPTVARSDLQTLMQETNETVHLSVPEPNGEIVYISKFESPRSIKVQTQLGLRVPAWCTATGRAILAYRPDLQEAVFSRPFTPLTDATETDPDKVRAILKKVVRNGYSVARGERHPEMGGLAAPIRDHAGDIVAACGIAAPLFRMSAQFVLQHVDSVLRAADSISAAMGYTRNPKT